MVPFSTNSHAAILADHFTSPSKNTLQAHTIKSHSMVTPFSILISPAQITKSPPIFHVTFTVPQPALTSSQTFQDITRSQPAISKSSFTSERICSSQPVIMRSPFIGAFTSTFPPAA